MAPNQEAGMNFTPPVEFLKKLYHTTGEASSSRFIGRVVGSVFCFYCEEDIPIGCTVIGSYLVASMVRCRECALSVYEAYDLTPLKDTPCDETGNCQAWHMTKTSEEI